MGLEWLFWPLLISATVVLSRTNIFQSDILDVIATQKGTTSLEIKADGSCFSGQNP
jgi:hypothetical protein